MAPIRFSDTLRVLCLAGACALGAMAVPAHAQGKQMDVLLAQLMTEPAADTVTRGASACVAAGPGGELVIRQQPGCTMEATADTVRQAVAALDVPRQTPECRRIGHCRPSRSFSRLHSLATLSYERGRLGGPRYWGQQY